MTGSTPRVDLVIPTVGRPSLGKLLGALAGGGGPLPNRIFLVDDRRRAVSSLLLPDGPPSRLSGRVRILEGGARGPAAARNVGWKASDAEWIAFLDDDVIPAPDWTSQLSEDLKNAGADVAGTQGRLVVPLPVDQPLTDWERNIKGLEDAAWITADMAYRRTALTEVGGFDERFPRAYREDADLGLRVTAAGYEIIRGRRKVTHPVPPAGPFASVRRQAGNADDALMRAVHGPGWRKRAGVPPGRRPRHLATTASGIAGIAGLLSGRRKLGWTGVVGWFAGTAEFAWGRISPGPRTPDEVGTMLLTSLLIPPAATGYWLSGLAWSLTLRSSTFRGRKREPGDPRPSAVRPQAVLLDRDGTLVVDVPYNGDPALVAPMPGARQALDRLRASGIPLAGVSNQSGIARGLLTPEEVAAVNRRVEELVGPLGAWEICPHAPDAGCECRKPAPGLVFRAASRLGVDPARCAVVGDIGSDIGAARAAGARGVLVPTAKTRPEEIENAPEVAENLGEAVGILLGDRA